MEGNGDENIDRLFTELEEGPERVLVQTLESFDVCHSEYLESVVQFARNRRNPLGPLLLQASGGRLQDDFRSCLAVIHQVEELPEERVGLVGWLLHHELEKRTTFMNFYTNHTGYSLPAASDTDAAFAARQLLASADSQERVFEFWRVSMGSAVAAFVKGYKA